MWCGEYSNKWEPYKIWNSWHNISWTKIIFPLKNLFLCHLNALRSHVAIYCSAFWNVNRKSQKWAKIPQIGTVGKEHGLIFVDSTVAHGWYWMFDSYLLVLGPCAYFWPTSVKNSYETVATEARGWKWKWSNSVKTSEMDLFWCISMTNNTMNYLGFV